MRAIVLRIDSPGGSATASDAIWRELMLARQEKPERPLVVSMSDLAASGGYYIAMPRQVIVAQPSTLTGSIGIYGGQARDGRRVREARRDTSSRRASAATPKWVRRRVHSTPRNSRRSRRSCAPSTRTSSARRPSRGTPRQTTIDSLAQGRVWTGRQAKENGLVDELGGLDRAIAIAKAARRISRRAAMWSLSSYPRPKSFYEMVSEGLSGNSEAAVSAWMSTNLSADELTALRALRGTTAMFRRGEPLALMPFTYVRSVTLRGLGLQTSGFRLRASARLAMGAWQKRQRARRSGSLAPFSVTA